MLGYFQNLLGDLGATKKCLWLLCDLFKQEGFVGSVQRRSQDLLFAPIAA